MAGNSKQPKVKTAAVIDIGSNEITLRICEKSKSGLRTLELPEYPVKIGRDSFITGKISFEQADLACEIIKKYLLLASEYNTGTVRIIATTAVREAQNREYILDQIRLKTGRTVDVIDMRDEKSYIYKMMFSVLPKELKQKAMMVYIGSGNLGISLLEKEKISFAQSVRTGPLRLSELFGQTQEYSGGFHILVEEYLESFTDPIEKSLPEAIDTFIAAGRDIWFIGELCSAKKNGVFMTVDRESFMRLYDDVKYKSPGQLSGDLKITREQSELLLPAMCIYKNLFEFTQAQSIVAPDVTLADAVMMETLYPDEFASLTKDFSKSALLSAKSLAKKFDTDTAHAEAVDKFSLKIFDKIRKIHGLQQKERLLLQSAAILHDVGKFININKHYIHSYNIIRGLEIIELNLNDMEIIANISLYHSNITPKISDTNYQALSPGDRVTVSKLLAILRLADSLDRSHDQKSDDIEVKLEENELIISIRTQKNIELEQWSFREKCAFFDEVFGIKAVLKLKKTL